MHFHISLIPRGVYFLLPQWRVNKKLRTSGWNFTKCISEVKVNQLQVKNIHVKMGISIFKAVHNLMSNLFWFFGQDFDSLACKQTKSGPVEQFPFYCLIFRFVPCEICIFFFKEMDHRLFQGCHQFLWFLTKWPIFCGKISLKNCTRGIAVKRPQLLHENKGAAVIRNFLFINKNPSQFL